MSYTKTVGVYCIRNKVNGKVYIGSSKDIRWRWIKHRSQLKRNHHINHYLQEDYNLYGATAFEYEILERLDNADKDTLLDREQYYIDNTENLYNIYLAVDGSAMPYETKIKMINSLKGRESWNSGGTLTEEHKSKISEGLKRSYAAKNQIGKKSRCRKNNNISEEERRKRSEAISGEKNYFYGKHYCGALNFRAQKVQCVETGVIYDTLAEAEKATGISHSKISMCCTGKRKGAGGFCWQYINNKKQ